MEASAAPLDCTDLTALSERPTLSIGRVKSDPSRVNFVKGSSEATACPAAADVCRAKAFLVPGNSVILDQRRHAGFACSVFVGRKGAVRAGWLPIASVEAQPTEPVSIGSWLGTWTREEADIRIAAGSKPGVLAVTGEATYGGRDPDRVKRGAVNSGSIEGTCAPDGPNLDFAMTDAAPAGATPPADKGGEYDCKVWMRRLGPYLLVDDNNMCGGFNVSFRGIYTKRPKS